MWSGDDIVTFQSNIGAVEETLGPKLGPNWSNMHHLWPFVTNLGSKISPRAPILFLNLTYNIPWSHVIHIIPVVSKLSQLLAIYRLIKADMYPNLEITVDFELIYGYFSFVACYWPKIDIFDFFLFSPSSYIIMHEICGSARIWRKKSSTAHLY